VHGASLLKDLFSNYT